MLIVLRRIDTMSENAVPVGTWRQGCSGCAPVTSIERRRRGKDVITSITFVLGGVVYPTIPVSMSYTRGEPLVLYVVPTGDNARGRLFDGPLECVITDNAGLAAAERTAR